MMFVPRQLRIPWAIFVFMYSFKYFLQGKWLYGLGFVALGLLEVFDVLDDRVVKGRGFGLFSGPPYGWRWIGSPFSGTLRADPIEQEILAHILEMNAAGMSPKDIAARLNSASPWSSATPWNSPRPWKEISVRTVLARHLH